MPEQERNASDDSTLFEKDAAPKSNGTSATSDSAKADSAKADSAKAGESNDAPADGLSIARVFSAEGTHPFDEFDWEERDAAIRNQEGEAIFEQKGVEFPEHFSQLATNIVASKYFYGDLDDTDTPPEEGGRETSLRELVHRVTRSITDWGAEQGYFATDEDAERFYEELTWLTVNQYGAFNSPVWFNVGLGRQYGTRDSGDKKIFGWDPTSEHVVEVDPYVNPQASACFIISVDDSIDDIWQLMGESARLFKFGSGVGADWSTLRSTKEKLSGGGVPSGPVSFMKVQDETGDTIKSGGKTRRAAIMQTLKCWHPDVLEFVETKQKEEKKAWALIDAGYDGSFNGPAYGSVGFQNVNQSLRVTDDFMEAAKKGESYDLRAVTTGETVDQIDAAELLHKVGEGTYICGDPGLQYEDTMQKWHTCKNTAPINSTNPCVTGDTLVSTADGLRAIRDMLGETPRIVGLDGELHRAARVVETGEKPVYRLRTKSGYELKLTADHRVWTENRGDVPAAELTKDDKVRLLRPRFGTATLEEDAAEYVGLLLGDGCRSEDILTLTMDKEREVPVVEKAAATVNNLKTQQRGGPVTVRTKTSTSARISCCERSVVDLVSRHAVLNEGSAAKRLTSKALRLDRESTAALLRGLFTADGTVADYGDKSQYVALDSTSEELLQQVQQLLLGFGIKAKIYRNRRVTDRALLPDGNGGLKEYDVEQMHSLRITRSSRVRFEEEEVGFMPESRKAAALTALNERVDTYRDRMTDRVKSLDLLGEETVYDLTEPDTRHFAAAGVAVHNCSEYVFLDDSACNLASLNLRKYQNEDGSIDVERLRAAARVFITAQEILVDNAGYPSHDIAENSHAFRPLGLGFANLGALLMSQGLPYDSDEGRAVAGAVQAISHCEAYARSAEIAANKAIGPFDGFAENEEPMLEVMNQHRDAIQDIDPTCPDYLRHAAQASADRMVALGRRHGYRNAQATVIAPTGCLVENSLVSTDRGLVRLGTLGDTGGEEWQDTSFRVFTDEGPQEATKFYVNGEAETRKIQTSAGYTIQGTCKHKIKVVSPNTGEWTWKRFDAIEEGDIVPLAMNTLVGEAREVKLPPLGEMHWNADFTTRVPRTVSPKLAELVGYFMGDGSLHAKGLRFCVASEDADVAARLGELVEDLFGLATYAEEQDGYLEVGVHSVPLALWWEACGFDKIAPEVDHYGKGYQPLIPDAVLHTNDSDAYGAFLRGLFEADGTLLSGVPALCTASRAFAGEVRSLMLALGYPTHTKHDEGGWGGTTHVLRLKNRSYNAPFRREIGFVGARKQGGIRDAATRRSAKGDRVYVGRELIDEVVPAGSQHRNAVLTSMRRHDGGVARQRLEQVYEDTGDERLVRYMGFFYDTVAANDDGGVQPTYDLSVPENVTYTAGGFISHNTIGFYMDCDTTGIEPDIALVKWKKLAGEGEGMMKIVNQTVPDALERLGYSEKQREAIIAYIDEEDTIEGAPHLKDEHLPVFDCAFEPAGGERSIHHMGHIRMMAAVQPFVSGAISKTVNVPESATPDEIADAYQKGWELGLKAIAIYRENSKRSQPLSTSSGEEKEDVATQRAASDTAEGAPAGDGAATQEPMAVGAEDGENVVYKPVRKRLPDERPSLTHKFSIAGHEGYLHIGLYPESKQPGEIFITMAKQGSTLAGMMDAFATSISIAMQYGVPLRDLCSKFSHMRFEPSGFTGNDKIPIAKSIMDYIFRYLAIKFLDADAENGELEAAAEAPGDASVNPNEAADATPSGDASGSQPHAANTHAANSSGAANGATNRADGASPMQETVGAPTEETPDGLVGRTVEAFMKRSENGDGPTPSFDNQEDAPPCSNCGSITVRNGSCYMCPNCGTSTGCG